jgi:predicted alpha/beta-hydrolase family hydrolase
MAESFMPWIDNEVEPHVRGFLHRSAQPNGDGLVLTHGAGANCQSPLLIAVGEAMCDRGFTVLRCDLPFRQERPHGPPLRTADRDQQGIRNAAEALRKQISGRVFLGGHSYGGRQSSMLAAAEPDVASALLLLSYPLHPPKRPQQLRTAHFPQLRAPALFVTGTRDGFGTLDELGAALTLIPAKTELLPVQSAGHELLTKKNRDELPRTIADTFSRFVEGT